MAVVVLKFSNPVYNRAERVDGTLNNAVLGYKNTAIVVQSNVPLSKLQESLDQYAQPEGYFLEQPPQVSENPAKTAIFQVMSVCSRFDSGPLDGITRVTGTGVPP